MDGMLKMLGIDPEKMAADLRGMVGEFQATLQAEFDKVHSRFDNLEEKNMALFQHLSDELGRDLRALEARIKELEARIFGGDSGATLANPPKTESPEG